MLNGGSDAMVPVGHRYRRQGLEPRLLARCIEPRAERVHIVDVIGTVALNAVEEGAAEDVGRDAVEQQVADRIGHEMQLAVARIIGKLHVDIVDGSLPGEHAVGVLLVLVLLDVLRIEVADAKGRHAGKRPGHRIVDERLPRIGGNLVSAHGQTGERAHPGLRIEQR